MDLDHKMETEVRGSEYLATMATAISCNMGLEDEYISTCLSSGNCLI